ncbi:MAG: T9SS type A sorting domain-containing protein, partial [Bacteroidota bacterium]
ELIVSNSDGCSDTSGKNISIIYAACDLAIINVNRIIEGNTMSVNAEMINLSNIPMNSLNMYLFLNNNPGIMEIWEGDLDPGQILNYTFIANFIVDPDDLPDLVCVKADLNDCTDMNPGNNELCLQSDNVFTVYDPYPNPFSEDLTIEVYIPEANPLIIDMFDADGRIVFSKLFTQTIKGLNRYIIDLSYVSKGAYTLRVTYDNSEIKKVIKSDEGE